ncbi:hypothetical protein QYE76_005829 [Lolium multiflorum]|uniref:Uncharacterized protein n=1 Tax=Lolium multiflorum TaxID=4521 RepID=A0AAD8RVI6_LOLMU|nr:hypothetical protein QYE76_005829 [Lolium multiflorum]
MSASTSEVAEKPITYEDLPTEHKKKYDDLKVILEAELIGSFEKTRSRRQVQRIRTTRHPRWVGSVSPFEERAEPSSGDQLHGGPFTHRHSSLVNTWSALRSGWVCDSPWRGQSAATLVARIKRRPFDRPQDDDRRYLAEEEVRSIRYRRPLSVHLLNKYEQQYDRRRRYDEDDEKHRWSDANRRYRQHDGNNDGYERRASERAVLIFVVAGVAALVATIDEFLVAATVTFSGASSSSSSSSSSDQAQPRMRFGGGSSEEVSSSGSSPTMPFGLKNTGATYQRMMQKCLATQIGKNVQLYIENIVITTKQGSSLIDDLKETFDNLDRFRLKLNPTKCSFGVPAGELLGYLVSARGIEANPEKIQAIVTMRKPTKLKDIQQLSGRVVALSRFVARLGEKVLPFYELIKQGKKFEWNEEADKGFEHLKRYKALIHGMKMAKACGVTRLKIFGDSQLVSQQVMNKCNAVNDIMIAYKEVYNELGKLFDGCEVNHISRLCNDEADVLANIGSQCLPITPGVLWEEISERSTKAKKLSKQPKKKEKSKKGSGAPASPGKNTSENEEEPDEFMMIQLPWTKVYLTYITKKEIPKYPVEARLVI